MNIHWDITKAQLWTPTIDKIMLHQTDLPNITFHHNLDNAENIIKSEQTPQKSRELIKNDQILQTYTIYYMKLDELPSLELPHSRKNSTSKSSKQDLFLKIHI